MNIKAKDVLREMEEKSREKYEGSTPLFKALYDEDTSLVLKLLDEGADIEERDSVGLTPLCCAARFEDVEFLKELIRRGAEIDPDFGSGKVLTPLMFACLWGRVGNVRLLVDSGADVNRIDDKGYTYLWWADQCSDMEAKKKIISILISSGAI